MPRLSTTARNNRLAALKALNDVGGLGAGKGLLKIYSGSVPASVAASAGTLLSTLTDVTWVINGDGTATVSATADNSAYNDGSSTATPPTHARLTDSDGVAYMQLTAGVLSGELSFTAVIALGGTISLTSGLVTEGNS